MENNVNQDRNFELRSEKVRSIVGQIPTSIVRHGITVIGIVLAVSFLIAYFLPYKYVYSGTATIYSIAAQHCDSLEATVLLRFESKRPGIIGGQPIYIQSANGEFSGRLQSLSFVRDTLMRQEAVCRFKTAEIKSVENQNVDFTIIQASGNLLQKMLGGL